MPRHFTEQEVVDRIEDMRRRRPRFTDERITMAHGAGGKASRQLVEGLVVPALDNPRWPPWGTRRCWSRGSSGWR
jgi:hydrogenase expression/formation protein HypE